MSEHVFISYAQRNADRANEICNYLESMGIRCWIAPRDTRPGSEWQREIASPRYKSICTSTPVGEFSNSIQSRPSLK